MVNELREKLNEQASKLIEWNNENLNASNIHIVRENILVAIQILEAIR